MRVLMWAVCLAAVWSAPSGAAEPADIGVCLDCHSGSARRAVAPNLDGQHAAYLRTQLRRFREHAREAFPMDALAQGFDDALIDRLAATFAERAWSAPAASVDPVLRDAGLRVLERFDCAACHGKGFTGQEEIPRVAGQYEDYLDRQLRAFARDERSHPPTGNGSPMAKLDDQERQAAAAALAGWQNGGR
ncbi:MAG: hypothetical protein KDJ14_10025 [Xanthomonadales bacterium]|nr:hypothetical protein [Xanthomonadales bacterium]